MRTALAIGVAIGLASRPAVAPQVELRGKRLAVHLAQGTSNRDGPLLLYVTGDGGWPGDERLFERMTPWGYPMAAIDAIDYIDSINTARRELTPAAVAADLQEIIRIAQRGLELPPDRPTVLVGFSRGAGLAVVGATQKALHSSLRGVLLLGLGPVEVFVAEEIPAMPVSTVRQFRTYEALPRLESLRVALIQSTKDEILPASDAQRRFGPDGPTRRFRALTAKDHSFGGSLTELAQEMRVAVDWIVSDRK